MKWSLASELLDEDPGPPGASESSESLAPVGEGHLSSVPLFPGAPCRSAAVSKTKPGGASGLGRAMRAYLSQCSGPLQSAADVRPFSENSGAPHLRSERPAAIHSRRKLPRHAARHRRVNTLNRR